MDANAVLKLIILLLFVVLSALFSSAETALTAVNRIRLINLEEDGNKKAKMTIHVLDRYGKMLSAILICNNIVNLTASAVATTFALQMNIPVGVATAVLTIAILIFGEVVPKNMASVRADNMALFYAPFINFLMKLLTPFIYMVDFAAKLLLKLFRVDMSEHIAITEDELKTIVDEGHKDGVIESEERELIYNVFEFSDAQAKDIMIPRIDMVMVEDIATYNEVKEIFREHMYTRIPVYKDQKDNCIGILNMKDFILVENPDSFKISDIMRKPFFTFEVKKTPDLLKEMREERHNLALVLNEYGGMEGMITMEDLLEEIVGEIRDEYDSDEEELIQKMQERVYLIEGAMKLSDINDELGTELMSEDYDSIGGLVIERLDDLPEDGEEVFLEDGIRLKVQGVQNNRILKVVMEIPEPSLEETEEAEEEKDKKDKE